MTPVANVPIIDEPDMGTELQFPETESEGLDRWLLNWRMHGASSHVLILEGCKRVYCQICRAVFSYHGPYTLIRHASSESHKYAVKHHPPSVDWMGEIKWRSHSQVSDNPRVDDKIERNLRKRITSTKARKLPAWQLFGATIPFVRNHIESLWEEGMSWENYGSWHIDHITPVQAYNVDNAVHCLALCHYTNLQPLWGHDNLAKGSTLQ